MIRPDGSLYWLRSLAQNLPLGEGDRWHQEALLTYVAHLEREVERSRKAKEPKHPKR